LVTGGLFILAENSIMRNQKSKLNPYNVKLEIADFFSNNECAHLLEKALKRNTDLSISNIFRLTFELGLMQKQSEKC